MPKGFSDAAGWAGFAPERELASQPKPVFTSTGPQGHRGRMRRRVLDRGAPALGDYEILEMLLFFGIPRRDTKPIAKATINHFGSLASVLGASRARLLATEGLTEACADVIDLVQQAARCLATAEKKEAPVLGDWPSLTAYLALTAPTDLRVLYLDNKNRLLADEAQSNATIDTRAILRRALELHSVSLLLAAWRDDPVPGHSDCDALRHLRALSASVSVGVHDFTLVHAGRLVSVSQAT